MSQKSSCFTENKQNQALNDLIHYSGLRIYPHCNVGASAAQHHSQGTHGTFFYQDCCIPVFLSWRLQNVHVKLTSTYKIQKTTFG